ncbi:MAG TPA: hypothetical protein VG014_02805 [Acidimicrobiales bacterium]|nr:hypothetical protein [Acidimicrobiales bacterium]
MPDDDRLLERLGRAFAPPPAEPSAAERRTLHRAVARLRSRPTRASATPEPTAPAPERVVYLPPMILGPVGAAIGVAPTKLPRTTGS